MIKSGRTWNLTGALCVLHLQFKIENKMENLASGNAADIGCQYLMQGMSHTALEVFQLMYLLFKYFWNDEHLYFRLL